MGTLTNFSMFKIEEDSAFCKRLSARAQERLSGPAKPGSGFFSLQPISAAD